MLRALFVLSWFCFVLARATGATAHELEVDQLSLWTDPAGRVLRGQLLCAPELSRAEDAPPDERARASLLDFARGALDVRVDGQPLPLEVEVRELWSRGGAVPGDSVMLEAALPSGGKALTVRAPRSIGRLLLRVGLPSASGGFSDTTVLLAAGEQSPPFRLGLQPGAVPAGSSFERLGAFVWLGVRHIVPLGLDHLAFTVALVLGAASRPRRLVVLLSGFTLAHTLTLGLGATGVLALPARVVEPLIALSIVVVALENLRRASTPLDFPLVLSFGLLHGFGFAGALRDRGIEGSVWLPLLGFNVGVELGQLGVAAVVWSLTRAFQDETKRERFLRRPVLVAIALSGVLWTAERLLG